MRADKFFAEKFGSRTKAAEMIEKGLILINGKPIKPKTEVSETDEFDLFAIPAPAPVPEKEPETPEPKNDYEQLSLF